MRQNSSMHLLTHCSLWQFDTTTKPKSNLQDWPDNLKQGIHSKWVALSLLRRLDHQRQRVSLSKKEIQNYCHTMQPERLANTIAWPAECQWKCLEKQRKLLSGWQRIPELDYCMGISFSLENTLDMFKWQDVQSVRYPQVILRCSI